MAKRVVVPAEHFGRKLEGEFKSAADSKKALEVALKLVKEAREMEYSRFGVVVGPIHSDGEKHTMQNLNALRRLADHYNFFGHHGVIFPVISPGNMSNNDYIRLFQHGSANETDKGNLAIVQFLTEFISSGFVTDIVKAPRSDESSEARLIITVAQDKRLNVIDEGKHNVDILRIIKTSRRDLEL